MADGRVEYEVRASTEQLDADLLLAQEKTRTGAEKIGEVSGAVSAAVGEAFASASAALSGFGETFGAVMEAGSAGFTETGDLLSGVTEGLTGVYAGLLETVNPLIEEALPTLGELFAGLAEPVQGLVSEGLNVLSGAVTQLTSEAVEPLGTALQGLGETFGLTLGEAEEAAGTHIGGIRTVFDGLLSFVRDVFTGNWRTALEGIAGIFSSVFEGIKSAFKAPLNYIIDGINTFIRGINSVKVPDWVPGVGGKGFDIPAIPRLRVGLSYVPSDDFPALLHEGESVLTKAEADVWRSIGGLSGAESAFSAASAAGSGTGGGNIQSVGKQVLFEKAADYFVVREDADIDRIADELFRRVRRAQRGKGGALL